MFKVFRGDPIEICVILASFYGMRRSEALGVKWSSIDFVNKTISVRHVVTDIYLDGKCQHISKDKTKSKSSTRKLPLVPQFETALVELYKKQQIQRELCGEDYSLEYLDYINKNDMGERLKPGYISDHFSLILKKNGLRKIRFHDLRYPNFYKIQTFYTNLPFLVDLLVKRFGFYFSIYRINPQKLFNDPSLFFHFGVTS